MPLQNLDAMIGQEHDLDSVNDALRRYVQLMGTRMIGAIQITCSDEAELECLKSFHERFCQYLLPDLKMFHRMAMNTANLGARYERASLWITTQHFSTGDNPNQPLVIVARINSHVGKENTPEGLRFGLLHRYGQESTACGALNILLQGQSNAEYIHELEEQLRMDNLDRIALLRDPNKVCPEYRSLYAAITNAVIQSRRVLHDAETLDLHRQTSFLILASVTLNSTAPDTDLVCGYHHLQVTPAGRQHTYHGLGDNPARYQLTQRDGKLLVFENQKSISNTVNI
ncbi:MAG: hypothetical protein HJJLKODD_00747 [Phycisphaerae bacterium]|nr:hypothetical protein [Phycisphaerae bacterium]